MSQTNDTPIFEIDSSLKEWQVPAREWLNQYAKRADTTQQQIDGLCTGSAIFNDTGKILLIQRADHDSSAGYWEVPGGAVDEDDETILHGVARELREETGLTARRINHIVISDHNQQPHGLTVIANSRQKKHFGRAIFQLEVHEYSEVRLDPKEHQNFVWASEDEVKATGMSGSKLQEMHASMQQAILAAFQSKSESRRNT